MERSMTPELMLNHKLGQAARRVRLLLVFRWAARVLCWTALACLAWLLASKANWLAEPSPEILGITLGIAALLGIAIGFVQRLSPLDVARLTDKRTSMKERLASAVEFQKLAADDPILARQIQDAGSHAEALDL